MARTPRAPARILLAGRYVVPRMSLVALPSGPVVGLDLACGELVGLAFGPNGDEPVRLESRIAGWNELHLQECPVVHRLAWQLGRPLVVYDPPLAEGSSSESPAGSLERLEPLARSLSAAGLGLPVGAADLALGPAGPSLRRPAIWPSDDARALSVALAQQAMRLLERAPRSDVADPPRAPRRRCSGLVPRSRRVRFACLVACGVVSIVAVASTTAGSQRDAAAAALPPLAAPPALALTAPLTPPRRALRVAAAVRAISRGGPARVLLAPVERHVEPAVAATPAQPDRVAAPRSQPGWVAGLFVGS